MAQVNDAFYNLPDDTIRLEFVGTPDASTIAQLKVHGFRYWPGRKINVSSWRPGAEDYALELFGVSELEHRDEEDDPEARAERFDGYKDNAEERAQSAHEAVDSIASNIPFGQPILVGHHSEKRARRDAGKIENGMRRAAAEYEKAEYWQHRAQAAVRHAAYKAQPAVIARRIKRMEADRRREERNMINAKRFLLLWNSTKHEMTLERAKNIANYDDVYLEQGVYSETVWGALNKGAITAEQAKERTVEAHEKAIRFFQRCLDHADRVLAYQRELYKLSGGISAERAGGPEVGGGCTCWASEHGAFSYIQKVNKVSVTILRTWRNGGTGFTQTMPFDKLRNVMTKAQVDEKRAAGMIVDLKDNVSDGFLPIGFILLDEPKPTNGHSDKQEEPEDPSNREKAEELKAKANALAAAPIVAVDQLFPTPADLVNRMIREADIGTEAANFEYRILEPSAGTGAIADIIRKHFEGVLVCCEINYTLADHLAKKGYRVVAGDFLERFSLSDPVDEVGEVSPEMVQFDRVIMNPPFSNSQDIDHVRHAFELLKPGGRIVAIMSEGPFFRQDNKAESFRAWLYTYGTSEKLPKDTFKESGTMVQTRLVVIDKPL